MPFFTLTVSAELESVASVALTEAHAFRVLFTCGSCREPAPSQSVFTAGETTELPNGRGAANLVQKCKGCSAPFSVDVSVIKGAALTAAAPSAVLAELECRGAVPTSWVAGEGWIVVAAGGEQTWDDVDLSEDFCDFDEAAAAPAEVRSMSGAFALKK